MTIDELFAELDKKGNSATGIIKDLFDKKYIYLKSKDGEVIKDKWPEDAEDMLVLYRYKHSKYHFYDFVRDYRNNVITKISKDLIEAGSNIGSYTDDEKYSSENDFEIVLVELKDIKDADGGKISISSNAKYINTALTFGEYYTLFFNEYMELDSHSYPYKKIIRLIKRMNYKHDYIISGPPGTGKSHSVNNEFVNDIMSLEKDTFSEELKEILVKRFLMTNASMHEDLFGAYKPVKCDDKIKYEFVPGPFSEALKGAYDNPRYNYVMIIEELNRGNSSEVLGDLLQLFDRNEMNESKYKISTPEVAKAYFEMDQLYLPNNLFVVCTMNNSDAGVFPISDELRRRFIMSYIDIDGNYYGAEDFAEVYKKVADGTERKIIKSEDYIKWLKNEKIPRYYFDKYEKGEKLDAEELVLALLMYKNSHDSKAGYSVKNIITKKVREVTEIKLEDIF